MEETSSACEKKGKNVRGCQRLDKESQLPPGGIANVNVGARLSNVLYPNVLARSRIWILIEQRRQRRRRTFIDSKRSPDDSAIRSHIQSGGPCILIPLLRSTRYPEIAKLSRTKSRHSQGPILTSR
ncbi:hypothetical protein V1477_005117 [Vespula maculifrons]|uniref:Uncharacterized protein n=2 Tax=Vespula TaxID=7451 RepID=A0A834KJA3_VESVU|nr:hypothetical protein HZH66_002109 [Vespula vulgaris]